MDGRDALKVLAREESAACPGSPWSVSSLARVFESEKTEERDGLFSYAVSVLVPRTRKSGAAAGFRMSRRQGSGRLVV